MNKRFVACALVALFACCVASAGVTFYKEFKNVDYKTFGVGGLRDVGTGDIDVAGIEGHVVAAYLYWNSVVDITQAAAGEDCLVDGIGVTGTGIGLASSNCWNYPASASFRADLTDIVRAKKNGTYHLAGFLQAFANGNGASLVIIFDDGNSFNNVDVRLYDGNDSNIGSVFESGDLDSTLDNAPYNGSLAILSLHVADGQKGEDDGDDCFFDKDLLLNGVAIATDPVFSGDSVPAANDGPGGNGRLWDIKHYDVSAFMLPGLNDLHLFSEEPFDYCYDCWSLVLATVLQPTIPACSGIQLQNLICGDSRSDPADGKLKRTFRPGTVNIDGVTLRDIFDWNRVEITDRVIVQFVCVEKETPYIKCTAFYSGPGAGLNTNFKTGLKYATNQNLDDPVCNVAFGMPNDQECLGTRCLLFSTPCTRYTLCVIYVVRKDNGSLGPPQTIKADWVVSMPTRETIRCNIEYFSTVALGVTQKCKITSDVAEALNECLNIPEDLEALLCFETVVGNASVGFADIALHVDDQQNFDARFLTNYLIDSDEEPVGCLLDEMALALLFHP